MNFKGRLILLGLSGILGALVVGIFSLVVQSRMGGLVETQTINAQALRHQLEADMMHDAVKADLYEALHARVVADEAKLASARAGLDEHAAWCVRVLDDNKSLGLAAGAGRSARGGATRRG